MTQRQLASLLCKFLGLYVIIQMVTALGMAFQWILMGTTSPGVFNTTLPVLALTGMLPRLLQGAFGVLLLIFADGIAAFMVPDDDIPLTTGRIWAFEMSTIAFAVIGLLTLSQGLPRLAEVATNYFVQVPRNVPRQLNLSSSEAQLISSIMQTMIGLWLFLRSRALAQRFYPVPKTPPQSTPTEQT